MKWMNEVFPDNDQWQKFSNSIVSLTESLKNSIEMGKEQAEYGTCQYVKIIVYEGSSSNPKISKWLFFGFFNSRRLEFDSHIRHLTSFLLFINTLNLLDPQLKKLGEDKLSEWRNWFDSRLDNAIEATEIENQFEGAESEFFNWKLSINSRMIWFLSHPLPH